MDYGSPEPQLATKFADYACDKLRDAYIATQHRVTNTRVERSGDTALAESYILAFHVQQTPDGKVLHTFNGRWLDTFECRNGEWRISNRVLRVDWSRADPWRDDMAGNWTPSARDRSDILYSSNSWLKDRAQLGGLADRRLPACQSSS